MAVKPLVDLFHRDHLSGLDQLSSVLSGIIALSGAAVAAWAKWGGPDSWPAASDEQLDRLANAVDEVCTAAVADRRLNRPHPLPLSWTTVPPPEAEHWANVRADGLDAPLDLARTVDVGHPDGLLELVTDPRLHGRVVILGEPGAGKTVLLLRLTQQLLERRSPGEPVPVFLSMSAWNPEAEKLAGLIAQQTRTRYGFYSALSAAQIFPILDGLDEMPPGRRAQALREINGTFRKLVLTSRTAEYRDTLKELGRSFLHSAAVVTVLPLDPGDVRDYLVHDDAPAQWSDLNGSLSAPLWVDLARTVYGNTGLAPDDLIGRPVDEVHGELLDRFVPAAYEDRWTVGVGRCLRTVARTMRSADTHDLAWWDMVRGVPERVRLTVGLVFGTLALLVTTAAARYAGLYGLSAALLIVALRSPARVTASPFRWRLARVLGLGTLYALALVAGQSLTTPIWIFGIAGCVVFALRPPSVSARGRVLRRGQSSIAIRLIRAVLIGIAVALPVGIAFAAIYREFSPDAPSFIATAMASCLIFGMALGLPVGILAELTNYLQEGDADLTKTAHPQAAYRTDRWRALLTGPLLALLTWATVWSTIHVSLYALFVAPSKAAATSILGFTAALKVTQVGTVVTSLVVGLSYGLITSAWGWFQVARLYYHLTGEWPWRIMAFLDDAHKTRVLRQVGAVYQFRHVLLRDRLAASGEGAGGVPPDLGGGQPQAERLDDLVLAHAQDRTPG